MTSLEAVRLLAAALYPVRDPAGRRELSLLAWEVYERYAAEWAGTPVGLLVQLAAVRATDDYLSLARNSARAAAGRLERQERGEVEA